MTYFARITLTVLLVSLFSMPVSAREQRATSGSSVAILEELMDTEITTVTGASKYEQEISDAPAAVSIVSGSDIRKGGFRNLAEILNSVAGFYITYNRNYHFAGTRGFSPLGDFNTRILLLVDGHRLNDSVYEQAPIGNDFPVDIDLIDQIEIIRGPGSSLYGTNAFMAVINVVTRNARNLKGGELSVSGGIYNAFSGRVTGGAKTKTGIELLFSGGYHDTAGKQRLSFPEYTATNNGIAQGVDGESSFDLLTKVAWKDVTLLLLHQDRDKTVPTASYYSIFNDPAEKSCDRHTLAGLSYNRAGSFVNLNGRLTYNRYEFEGDFPLASAGVRTLNRDTALAEWIGADLFVSKTIGNHLLTIGVEQRWQFTQQQRNFNVEPVFRMVLDDTRHNHVQGYYLQDEFHILKNLILNAGLRADIYENFGTTINPRGALIWKPRDATVLRLTYGEAFRAPNAYELYYNDHSGIKGNPNLKPEKNRTLELGWSEFFGNNISTTVNGFYLWISDLLEQVTDPGDGMTVFINQSRVESRGIELQADGKWENGFSGKVSYTYQDTRNLGVKRFANNSPRNLVKGSITLPLPLKNSSATIEMFYGASRLNSLGEKVDGAAIVNLTLLNRGLVEGLDLSASVYNLFDTRYDIPAGSENINSLGEALRGIRQDGITFRIKATYRF